MPIATPEHDVIYGSELSYFSKKLEAAAQLSGLPFEFRPKTTAIAAEIESRAGTHQIPVLHTPDNWMIADTTPLITWIDTRQAPDRRLFPIGPAGVLVHVIEEWFDEWTPRLAVHYRWNYEESANNAAPKMAAELAADPALRDGLEAMVRTWGPKACRATGVQPESQQRAAEAEYTRVLEALDTQLATTRFALGDRPTAVDAVLLGGLRAHFLADPVPRRLVERYARVSTWCKETTSWDGSGTLAPFPETTAFGRFVLGEMRGPYAAFVLGNAAALAAGDKAFVAPIHGEDVSFRTRAYPERSRRMVKDRIARSSDGERRAIEEWLADMGLDRVFGA